MTCSACGRAVYAKGFCRLHYDRMRSGGQLEARQTQLRGVDLIDKLAAYISIDDDGCWRWTRSLRGGYGSVRVAGRNRFAHRVLYELTVEPVADGLHLDHLCRNTTCCNPDHLEPVEPRENFLRGEGAAAQNARKTHCVNGHEFTPENTYEWAEGRRCKACVRATKAARKAAVA